MAETTPSPRKKKGSLGADKGKATAPPVEPVWTFRGYELKASEFNTAMVHFFRAEISRANVWRQRLDATTNWAVLTTGAAITIAFSETSFHGVIILNTLLVTLFLMIEARRYRYYELWSSRVRLLRNRFLCRNAGAPISACSRLGRKPGRKPASPRFSDQHVGRHW